MSPTLSRRKVYRNAIGEPMIELLNGLGDELSRCHNAIGGYDLRRSIHEALGIIADRMAENGLVEAEEGIRWLVETKRMPSTYTFFREDIERDDRRWTFDVWLYRDDEVKNHQTAWRSHEWRFVESAIPAMKYAHYQNVIVPDPGPFPATSLWNAIVDFIDFYWDSGIRPRSPDIMSRRIPLARIADNTSFPPTHPLETLWLTDFVVGTEATYIESTGKAFGGVMLETKLAIPSQRYSRTSPVIQTVAVKTIQGLLDPGFMSRGESGPTALEMWARTKPQATKSRAILTEWVDNFVDVDWKEYRPEAAIRQDGSQYTLVNPPYDRGVINPRARTVIGRLRPYPITNPRNA